MYTADRASRVVTVRDDKFYSYQCFVMCQDDFTRTDWANSNQQVMKAFSYNQLNHYFDWWLGELKLSREHSQRQ